MLTGLVIEGFKSFEKGSIELGQLNVIIGANGSGKSNLLEALGVMGAAAGGRVDDAALLRRGVRPGLPALYKSSFQDTRIRRLITLTSKWSDDEGSALYRVGLDNPIKEPQPSWRFSSETVAADGHDIASRSPRGGGLVDSPRLQKLKYDAGLAALYAGHEAFAGSARHLIETLSDFAIFSPTTGVLRAIAPDPFPRRPVGLYGGNLAKAYEELVRASRGASWQEELNEATSLLTWVRRISAVSPAETPLSPSVQTSKTILRFTDRYMREGRNQLSAYDASEGALYTIFMLALAAHPDSPQLFAVDNFDQALNPRLARQLTEVFSRTILKTGRQALLTTHNPLVLDGLDLKDDRVRLFTVDRGRFGQSRVQRVEVDIEWLRREGTPLSRLWVTGRLGGIPEF